MVFTADGSGTQVRPVVDTQQNRVCLAGIEESNRGVVKLEGRFFGPFASNNPVEVSV